MVKLLLIAYMYSQEIYRFSGPRAIDDCEASALRVNHDPVLRELKIRAICLDTEARSRGDNM